MTGEPATENAVAAALAESDRLVPGVICRSLGELQVCLEKNPAAAVVVDLDPEPRLTLEALDPVIGAFSGTRFVVLAKEFRSDIVIEAMQAGARHFVVKDSIASQLAPALDRLLLNGAGTRSEGQGALVALLAASGGCGATTLAVNLANELQLLSAEPSLLVDLDAFFGSAAVYLGLRGDFGIADVLAKQNRIDAELITTTAVAHDSSINVLLSPASTSFSRPLPLEYEQLGSVLQACRQAYRYTVVDAPRIPMDAAALIAERSRLTLIVLQLTVKDVRVARNMMTALGERGVPPERVLPLVNRYRKGRKGRRTITLQEAQKALGVKPFLVSNDFKRAVRAFNFGQLLSRSAKRSALRKDLRNLALHVARPRSKRKRSLSR